MRKRQQHHRDRVGMRGAVGDIDAVGLDHGVELVHVVADRAHQDLARKNHVFRRGGALVLPESHRVDAERARCQEGRR